MKKDLDSLKAMASQVRRDIVRMVYYCQSGHPGGKAGGKIFFFFPMDIFLRYGTVYLLIVGFFQKKSWPLLEN